MALKKYNIEGKEVGTVDVPVEIQKKKVSQQMIKDYLVAIRANQRQWSANTQTRAEVSYSKQKPHAQKGTGKARQGFLGSPQYRGGGRVFGPRPKFDQHVRINKKERRATIRHIMAEKIQSGKVCVLEAPQMDAPKTKVIVNFLKNFGFKGKRILFLAEGSVTGDKKGAKTSLPKERYESFTKSLRNVPQASFLLMPNISGYDAALYDTVVVLEPAVDELMILLKE